MYWIIGAVVVAPAVAWAVSWAAARGWTLGKFQESRRQARIMEARHGQEPT